jgi:hypothetical protein
MSFVSLFLFSSTFQSSACMEKKSILFATAPLWIVNLTYWFKNEPKERVLELDTKELDYLTTK